MRTSHTQRRWFAWGSSKVKRIFFCESPFAACPGGRRTYEGWHDGKPSSWIKNVVFGVYFPFDIIGRIPAWPRKMAIMEINYYPCAYRTGDVIFVHCLLNWMLITNIRPTHPTLKALKKYFTRIILRNTSVSDSFLLQILVWVICGLRTLWCK